MNDDKAGKIALLAAENAAEGFIHGMVQHATYAINELAEKHSMHFRISESKIRLSFGRNSGMIVSYGWRVEIEKCAFNVDEGASYALRDIAENGRSWESDGAVRVVEKMISWMREVFRSEVRHREYIAEQDRELERLRSKAGEA